MQPTKFNVEYRSNNSGGGWWLKDADWKKLEDAGWTVAWGGESFCNSSFDMGRDHTAPDTCPDNKCPGHRRFESYDEIVAAGKDKRWLGSIATTAEIGVEAYSDSLAEGIAELWWEEALGMNASEEGCNCCGRPHNFWARKVESDGDTEGV